MMHTQLVSRPQHVILPQGVPPFPMEIEAQEPVLLRHLTTPEQIEEVLPLRDGIDLSAHAAAGAAFHSLEKKETNWGSSALSSVPAA